MMVGHRMRIVEKRVDEESKNKDTEVFGAQILV